MSLSVVSLSVVSLSVVSPPLCPSRERQVQGPVLCALPPAPAVDRLRPAPTEREGPAAGKAPLNSCCKVELVTTIGRAGTKRTEEQGRFHCSTEWIVRVGANPRDPTIERGLRF